MKGGRKLAAARAFFALCAAMTALYLIAGYGAYLDADMASELVLARRLADGMTPVSSTWHYSTEVRLINTQLVFAPLMALFGGSWRLVRTLGCIILLGMQAAVSRAACLRAGADRAHSLVMAGLGVLAISPLYAQNVIIGAYYIPHAILTLAVLALFAGLYKKKEKRAARSAVILALAFVLGLSSVRYLLCAIVPALCAAAWMAVFPASGEDEAPTGERLVPAGVALAACMAGAAGFLVNQRVLPALLHCRFDYYGAMAYADWAQHDLFAQMQAALSGLLSALGFAGGVPLMGAQGIVNALILLMLAAAAVLLRRGLRALCHDGENAHGRFAVLMAVFGLGVTLAAFSLLRSAYIDRYWLPVLMAAAPAMAVCLTRERNPLLRRLALLITCGAMLLSGGITMHDSMRHPQVETDMRMEAVNAARERGYTKGYATFWNANIITELTDDEIRMTAVQKTARADGSMGLAPYAWLEDERELAMDAPDEPVFLLLGTWEDADMADFLARAGAVKVELDGWINLYEIESQRALFACFEDAP